MVAREAVAATGGVTAEAARDEVMVAGKDRREGFVSRAPSNLATMGVAAEAREVMVAGKVRHESIG